MRDAIRLSCAPTEKWRGKTEDQSTFPLESEYRKRATSPVTLHSH